MHFIHLYSFWVRSCREMLTIMRWLFCAGVTLRGNSGNRSGRRARRVSAGVSEDALATDSGVFEAWGRRWAEVHLTLCGAKEPPSGSERDCSGAHCVAIAGTWWLPGRGELEVSLRDTEALWELWQAPLSVWELVTAVLTSPGGQQGPTPKAKDSLTPAGLVECCWQLEFSLQLWRQIKQAKA